MKVTIQSWDLWKIELPAGRVIGDCACHYDTFNVLVLCLKSSHGHQGWGFCQAAANGVFARPPLWTTSMPSKSELRQAFERDAWPTLRNKTPFELMMRRPRVFRDFSFLGLAVRIALWDLMAKVAELPLYQFLGGDPTHNRVRAYASGLDFHLSEEVAVALFKDFARRGFSAVKVKVGHPDKQRDLRRLQAVRETVGAGVEIAIDANEAWTCDDAVERIEFFEKEGMRLSYVEDPLPRTDMEGLARLNKTIDLDVVGHDYIPDSKILRRYVEHGAFSRLRVHADFDHALACSDIAADFNTPLIFGNSIFELCVHAAVALPHVDRFEFSDLAWNILPQHPVQFENGYAIAPLRPGHGLDPNLELLEQFSKPEGNEPLPSKT